MFTEGPVLSTPTTGSRAAHGIPRVVEVVVALVGLIVTAPLIALSALAIALSSRGPMIFRQSRVGRHGRHFVLYKLRTMRLSHGGPEVTASDDTRVTRIGALLRKMKLDEVPELWNVLKGDMSLVGPRPEVPRYVDPSNPLWQSVLAVRPGLTDPMTLRLRNEESLLTSVEGDREHFYRAVLQPFKLQGYLEYLQKRSSWSDIKVLVRTVVVVFFPRVAPPPTIQEIIACGGCRAGDRCKH